MALSRQERADLEKIRNVFARPLECPSGKPMGHEEVRRDDNGLPISYGRNGSGYRYEEECPNKHARCPHHEKEYWNRITFLLEDVFPGIRKNQVEWRDEWTMFKGWQQDRIGKEISNLDDALRIARTGAQLESDLTSTEIPSLTEADERAAPLEDEWRTLIKQSEVGRLRILAMLNAVLEADETQSEL